MWIAPAFVSAQFVARGWQGLSNLDKWIQNRHQPISDDGWPEVRGLHTALKEHAHTPPREETPWEQILIAPPSRWFRHHADVLTSENVVRTRTSSAFSGGYS